MTSGSKAVAVLMLAGLLAGGAARADDTQAPAAQAQAPQVQPSPAMPEPQSGPKPESKPESKLESKLGAQTQIPKLPDSQAQLQPQAATPSETKPADAKAPPASDQPSRTVGAEGCEVPDYLLVTESVLSKVADTVKARQRLDILVVGSASSALQGPDGAKASYPARLEAALREKLSGIEVNVATEVQVKKTAADVAERLEKLATDHKPTLVVWQTGTFDALKSVDPDDFRTAIDEGVAALQGAGADVLLMNLQYSPRMETMITVAPYLDNMRVSAEQHNVPLFDRFAMMRYWNETGTFDLFNPTHGFALAKRVHECLGQTLATFVIDAARINPAELRIQH